VSNEGSNSIAAAAEYANQQIAWYRDNPIVLFGREIKFLDKASARGFAEHVINSLIVHNPSERAKLIRDARSGLWPFADKQLRYVIAKKIELGEALPSDLREYTVDMVSGPQRMRGQQKADLFFRDIAVTIVVEALRDKFGINPTANYTGRLKGQVSGCQIVGRALGVAGMAMNYDSVAKVWERLGDI